MARQVRATQDAMTIRFELGEDDVARAGCRHAAVEVGVAVQVGVEAAEMLEYPLTPGGRPIARRDVVGGQDC